MKTVAEALIERAVGWRQGVVSQLQPVPHSLSDVDIEGWAAVPEPFATGGTSGGTTRVAAVAEALERHAAARSPLEIVTSAVMLCGRLKTLGAVPIGTTERSG